MPGDRRTAGSRRESWLPRLAGLAIVALLAAGGVAGYLLTAHPATKTPRQLSARVASRTPAGLIVPRERPGSSDDQLLKLIGRQGSVSFMPFSRRERTVGNPQWAADLMAGNTYIFIFLPTGTCLGAVAPISSASAASSPEPTAPKLALSHCDLSSAAQRWRRSAAAVTISGHDFYQYANLANRSCLTRDGATAGAAFRAALAPCSPAEPASQLLALW